MNEADTKDREFYWAWALHEENLLTNRGNFFLVGQSMLFAAFASLRATGNVQLRASIVVFGLLGIFVAIIWLGIGIGHYKLTRVALLDKLVEHEPRYLVPASSRRKTAILSSNFWISVIVPFGVLIAWIALLAV
ncbi:MAG: hypothetical protein NTU79_12355 [Planctomycetota bacterium]|nr:hypothetical protein [Planctomycetota bacterium]